MADLDPNLKLQAAGSAFREGRPADEAILTLLAHTVVSDGVVHADEIGFLARVRPGRTAAELADWARARADGPLDLEAIAAMVVEPDDRWRALRFIARMAWKDGELAAQERALLDGLVRVFALPQTAVDRVLAEMNVAGKERFPASRLLDALVALHWDAVQLASGQLVSEDLVAATPPSTEVVARIGLERVEVMAICTDGLVGRFREGAAFVAWADLVAWTRSRVLGESVRLHTEDGRSWSLVDARLSGLAAFLDRLLDTRPAEPGSEPPKVELVRGE